MSDISVPYSRDLNGFNEPIQIVGESGDGAQRFEVNLHDSNGEYLLHYNIRYDEKRCVRNSTSSGQQWQREERDGGMPFLIGREFTLDLIPKDGNKMQCMVDGVEQCLFRGRDGDLHQATKLNIAGDVQLKSVQLPGEQSTPQRRDTGGEADDGGVRLDNDPEPQGGDWGEPEPNEPQPNIVQPAEPHPNEPSSGGQHPQEPLPPVPHPNDPGQLSVPYHCPLQDFARTRRLRVVGTPTSATGKFEVILRLSNGDAILHFNPRLDQNCVYRNATHNNQWQPQWEDKSGNNCPFKEGEQFALDIIANGDVFICCVNGPTFCAYRVHGDINQVHTLQINGDVKLSQVLIA